MKAFPRSIDTACGIRTSWEKVKIEDILSTVSSRSYGDCRKKIKELMIKEVDIKINKLPLAVDGPHLVVWSSRQAPCQQWHGSQGTMNAAMERG